ENGSLCEARGDPQRVVEDLLRSGGSGADVEADPVLPGGACDDAASVEGCDVVMVERVNRRPRRCVDSAQLQMEQLTTLRDDPHSVAESSEELGTPRPTCDDEGVEVLRRRGGAYRPCARARCGDILCRICDRSGAMQARSGEDRIAQNPPVDTAASGDEESGHVRSDRRKDLAKLRSIEVMDLARDGPRGRDTRTDGRSRLGEGPRVVVDDEGTGPAIAEVGDAERTQRLEERRIEGPSRRV